MKDIDSIVLVDNITGTGSESGRAMLILKLDMKRVTRILQRSCLDKSMSVENQSIIS